MEFNNEQKHILSKLTDFNRIKDFMAQDDKMKDIGNNMNNLWRNSCNGNKF